jgi:hypothetical protein
MLKTRLEPIILLQILPFHEILRHFFSSATFLADLEIVVDPGILDPRKYLRNLPHFVDFTDRL